MNITGEAVSLFCFRISGPFVIGTLRQRPNRFLAVVDLDGQDVLAHVPNPGRMQEFFKQGAKVNLRQVTALSFRRTPYEVVGAWNLEGTYIILDSQLPNRAMREMFSQHAFKLPAFSDYKLVRPEFQYGASRFDFLLSNASKFDKSLKTSNIHELGVNGDQFCFIEVKSVNFVNIINGKRVAQFPDAPTSRGTRHMQELGRIAQHPGFTAYVIFFLLRGDAEIFTPAGVQDPKFAAALESAVKKGVNIFVLRCEARPDALIVRGTLPFDLELWKTGNV